MDPRPHPIHPRAELPHAGVLREDRRLPGAEEVARHDARRRDRRGQGLGPARPRRRRISDRHEVAVRRQEVAEAQVHLLQRGRERAGHVQGPRADGAQSAPAVRRLPHRLPRDRREGRLHLHSRRVLPRAARARGRAGEGARGRLHRQEHHGHGLRLRDPHPSRRRRLRSRRRNRAHRIAGREARAAAHQAAVPGGGRAVGLSDGRQQRRDAVQRAVHHPERRRSGSRRSVPRRTADRSCSASAGTWRSRARSKRRWTSRCTI